jgi:hypothetical protein
MRFEHRRSIRRQNSYGVSLAYPALAQRGCKPKAPISILAPGEAARAIYHRDALGKYVGGPNPWEASLASELGLLNGPHRRQRDELILQGFAADLSARLVEAAS